MVEQAAVLDHRGLGRAGRSRGEQDVGELPGQRPFRQALPSPARQPGQRQHRRCALESGRGRGVPLRRGEDQAGAARPDHLYQAPHRLPRIERQVGAARLEDRDHGGQEIDAALRPQGDPVLAAEPGVEQPARHPAGQVVELGVGELPAGARDGRRAGRAAGLLLEERGEGAAGQGGGAVVPLQEELLPLGGREEGQVRDPPPRVLDGAPQQGRELIQDALRGRGVEQVGAVGEREPQARPRLGRDQLEIELRRAVLDAPRLEPQARDLQPRAVLAESERRQVPDAGQVRPLQGEHHLEERRGAGQALRLQPLHRSGNG